ncbi:MAG: Chaperone protein IpgC [Chlamydiae bacterium]|nr:Chaperone protein IpgC [Chlamydiota bacterium]
MFDSNILAKIDPTNHEEVSRAAEMALLEIEVEGRTLRETLGLTDGLLEEIYSLAYGYYNQGKYKESLTLFNILVGTDLGTYKYVLGLAATYHQMKDYDRAIVCFFLALNTEPNNPIPAFYIADSFMKIDAPEQALYFLDHVIKMEGTEHESLKEKCKLLKKSLEERE